MKTTPPTIGRLFVRSAGAGLALLAGAVPAFSSSVGFEPNRGQTDGRVRFLSRGRAYVLFLTRDEAVLALGGSRAPLRVRLAGARSAAIGGEGLLPGKSHYLLGDDPARWRLDVPSYERVKYAGVYPGVDLVFYGNGGELEYDFVVGPGRNPRAIELELSGQGAMRLDPGGNLALDTEGGPLVWRRPVAYQVEGSARREIGCRYAVRGGGRVGFDVPRYDATRPLVIDPVLSYSSYLGGGGADAGHAIAMDGAGNVYVTGQAASADFPGATSFGGGVDAFVTKLDPSGATRLYSTYLGGAGADIAYAIAVDPSGNVYVGGDTDSTGFPTTAGAFQRVKSTGLDAFVTRLDAAGALTYSTFLGGSGMEGDRVSGVAVDATGNVVVVGRTNSMDFPTTPGVRFPSFRGGPEFDAFVARLNPAASGAASLVYSTFLGGSGNDAAFAVALDAAGNPHVAGGTSSSDFPASQSAYQGSNTAGSTDAFFTKLNATLTSLLYSSFLGGSASNERANGIGLDAAGHAVVTGQTTSSDFPTKNPLQTYQGGYDAFVAKFDPAADGDASLLYSTFLGGSGDDIGLAVAVDASGRAYVTGQTASNTTFPIANAVQATFGGGVQDAFVTKLDAAGTTRLYSTFLGGSGVEGTGPTQQGGHGIAVSSCGDAWVTGRTLSSDFPTASPAQSTPGGAGDVFVAKISDPDPPTIAGVVPKWGPVSGGSGVTIVGTCFRPGATAAFGGSAATGVTVPTSTAIAALTPAHAAGAVDVVVTNPGLPPATRTGSFTYGATGFFSVPPCRIVDTRNANGPLGGPAIGANGERTFAVTGACGIPPSAGAVSINITATQPTAEGHLRLYPGGTPLPLVSSLNFGAGQTRANNATVPLGPGGTIAVRCVEASGSVHFILDVNGYYE